MQPPYDDHLGNPLHSPLQDLQGNRSRGHRAFASILLILIMALLDIGFAIKKAFSFTTISAYIRLLFQQHWALMVL